MSRAVLSLFLVTVAVVTGCGGSKSGGNNESGNGNPIGPSAPGTITGSLAFSTTASTGWSTIDVSVSGNHVGTLRRYFDPSGSASCAAATDARIVSVLSPGDYSYSARANNGVTWSETATVAANGCFEMILQCSNRDCSR